MTSPRIVRAVLIPMRGDSIDSDQSKHVPVQFNPATLRVTHSINVKADNQGGNSSAAAQYAGKGESTLSVELLFDTTRDVHREPGAAASGTPSTTQNRFSVSANSDVRELTKRIADTFMVATSAGASGKPTAPPMCRFQWGRFQFTGMLASFAETLDFFAPEGVPLRATVALSFKADGYQFDFASAAPPAARDTPSFSPGGPDTPADKAAERKNQDPKSWRDVADLNELENPRSTPGTGLTLPSLSALAARRIEDARRAARRAGGDLV